MNTNSESTTAGQVQTIQNQLEQLQARFGRLTEDREAVQKEITRLRSALEGVSMGVKLQQEVDDENNTQGSKES